MSWKKVTLSGHDIAAGAEHRLQEAFATRFIAAGAPNDAVMKAHPAVPGRSIYSMRVPCAGDQRRAGGDMGG